jgi:maltose alpha-D-glucosyltransferase/alpha-amylase
VVADLIFNHSSDQHPWFQAARADRNSPYRDYYVWSDDPEKYAGVRIIFTDTETSNWTYDPVLGNTSGTASSVTSQTSTTTTKTVSTRC